MKLIRLPEARAGQRVGRDVTDARGSLLFKAGTVLTAELLARLRGWKITHVFVEDSPSQVLESVEDQAARARGVDVELDRVFGDVVSNPIMARLREAAGRYLKGRPR